MSKLYLLLKNIFLIAMASLPKVVFAQDTKPPAAVEQIAALPQAIFASEISTAKKLLDLMMEFSVKYSFQALGGIIVLAIGFMIANFIVKYLKELLSRKNIDRPVIKFICSMAKLTIVALAGLIALGKFGITIAPFIAGISVAGFGLSFAMQGPLSNYAAGATLIFTKPFKVGDIVEINNVVGEVQDMTLARTELKTVDGVKIMIPNKQIIGEIISNYSEYKKLHVLVGISYDSDVDKAIDAVADIIKQDTRVVKDPAPRVGISEFADSSINIYCRVCCKQSDYWDVKFSINRKIVEVFREKGITIPFPQRDVHIYETGKNKSI